MNRTHSRIARLIAARMEPGLAAALQGKRVLMQNRGVWTLFHARDSDLPVPFLRGDAFFSRLDGEWWMRFGGEPQSSPDAENGADVLLPKRTPFSAEVQ